MFTFFHLLEDNTCYIQLQNVNLLSDALAQHSKQREHKLKIMMNKGFRQHVNEIKKILRLL